MARKNKLTPQTQIIPLPKGVATTDLLSYQAAATAAAVSDNTLTKAVAEGKLPVVQVGQQNYLQFWVAPISLAKWCKARTPHHHQTLNRADWLEELIAKSGKKS